MNRNRSLKSFKQCFIGNSVRCQKLQEVFEMQSFGLETGPRSFCRVNVYYPVDNTLFEVSPEIRCSGVSSRYCRYGNDAAGSKPIWKLFVASPYGRLSWLPVSFLLHVKHTLSYRIVSTIEKWIRCPFTKNN